MQTILPFTTLGQWLGISRCQFQTRGRHSLSRRQLLNISGVSRVQCLSGNLWITRSGGIEDILLTAGTTRHFPADTRLLIEALDDSDLEITR
jgi:hypothetical protein